MEKESRQSLKKGDKMRLRNATALHVYHPIWRVVHMRQKAKDPIQGRYGSFVATANNYNEFVCLYLAQDLSAVIVDGDKIERFSSLEEGQTRFNEKMRDYGYTAFIFWESHRESIYFKSLKDAVAYAVNYADINKNERFFIQPFDDKEKDYTPIIVAHFRSEQQCTIAEWNNAFNAYLPYNK